MRQLAVTIAAAALAAACTKDNPNFCDPAADPGCAVDARPDSAPVACETPGPNRDDCPPERPVCSAQGVCEGCAADNDCDGRGATPVCFGEPNGACVACDENDHQSLMVGTAADNCPTAPMQVCDGATHTCRPCRADNECTSGVCNALTGECARTVLHVDNRATGASDSNDCLTPETACLTLAGAMAKVVLGTRYVAIYASSADYTTTAETLVGGGARVYIVGIPDPLDPSLRVKFDRVAGNGPIVRVTDSSTDLTMINVTLMGAAGSGDGDGVICANDARLTFIDGVLELNAHFGITAAACDLVIDRSIIRGNLRGAGSISGAFSITNSFIVDNVGTNFGGLSIADLKPTDTLAHNTFAQNRANTGMPGSLACVGTGIARNNIMYGSAITAVEVNTGGCAHEYSLIGTTMIAGTGNFTAATIDALQFDLTATPPNYHIRAGSAAIGRGGPGDATGRLATDIDRQPRPTTMADVGADELP